MKGHQARRAHRRMRWLLTLCLGALVGPAVAGTTQPERTWFVSGAELITLLQGKGADGFCDGEHCRGLSSARASSYILGVADASRCLPISGSCPACDCNRMRLPWLSKGCARRFPVVAAHRLVAVPSPARHAETRGLGVGNAGCSLRNEHIGVLHAGDTMHSRPPTPAPATLHAPFSA